MTYYLDFTKDALKDIEKLRKVGNKKLLVKLASFYLELEEHPRTGTGQIELLRHCKKETFSRRLDKKHRLVYQIYEETIIVLVISSFGHYEDK